MVRKNSLLRLAALLVAILALAGCSTKSTDTGALRADLDALELELDRVVEENARLQLRVEDLEIELEKQKLALQETETALAQIPSVSEPSGEEAVSMAAPEEELLPDVELTSSSESELVQSVVEEPATEAAAEPSVSPEAATQPEESSPPSTEVLQAPEQEAEPKSEAASSQVQVGNTVYITKTGKKYHTNPSCNGATYYECSLEDAIAKGLTPCKKCAGG